MKPTRFIDSMNCAIEGVLYTVRTQKHMRYHFLAALVVLFAALLLRVSSVEFVLLSLAISFVLFAELLNTAIEVVVDMISPEFHPMAKAATGSGTPLKGGVPSGHSAVAFSIATSVSLETQDPLISLLCLILAVMVSHSRLLLSIHTMREVVYGALTGIFITISVTLLFKAVG